MLNSLTLPALAVLFSFPGFGIKKPPAPAPVDTLPPPWKSAPELALEDTLEVTPGLWPLNPGGPDLLHLTLDPRRLVVEVDPDSNEVRTVAEFGDVPLGDGVRQSMKDYAHDLNQRTFEQTWRARSRTLVNSLGNAVASTQQHQQGFSFQLPSPLPKRVQSWLGPGGPAINVSGSENITLSGTSNWTNQQIGLQGTKPSLFPSLDMQQNLDIRLEGQLSDRIKVNLLQNSANQIPLANRIAINYHGEEDDVVQELDLGNTNLSLPGTQYVSYSGKNEGLFGTKLATRMGPLDLTLLASRQEGRSERASYAGGASKQQQTMTDVDYDRGRYYMFYDPNADTTLDISIPSLKVYVDNANAYNVQNATVKGRAYVDPRKRTPRELANLVGNFVLLNPDVDYTILDYYGPYYHILRLRTPLSLSQKLAVTYSARYAGSTGDYNITVGGVPEDTTTTMKLLRAPIDSLSTDPKMDPAHANYDTTRALDIVRQLEMKNFYQLPGTGIDPKSFQLNIRHSVDQPYVYTELHGGESVPYIELLGLDDLDELHGAPTRGHDNQIDGTPLQDSQGARYKGFIDFDNGILFFPDPRPFAPRIGGPGRLPFDGKVSTILFRRDSLVGTADTSSNGMNPNLYDRYETEVSRTNDARYYFDLSFTAQRAGGEIQLGRGNITEGSEVVTLNGVALQRDRDYTIDYDIGKVVLKRQPGPSDNLNIDYSYAPLFQQAGRTLIGSAFQLAGRERSLGGAFLYESHGAQDLRPRLGEEPSRSLIGDLNTDWAFHPSWVTRLADHLPGVRTTTPSDFRVQAETGVSLPNPNTANQVYIDDMEGTRDAVSLSMDPTRWRWGSVPSRAAYVGSIRAGSYLLTDSLNVPNRKNAEVHWFLPPRGIKESDLKPNLNSAQGAGNNHPSLAISVPKRPASAGLNDSLWVSLTYPLDPVGLDLSRSQFIELWVNDWNDQHDGTAHPRVRGLHVKLHLDLGTVSEDQMRAPDEPPDGVLNTEDDNRDGQLSTSEDNGIDGKADGQEGPKRDLVTATDIDHEGDDYQAPSPRTDSDDENLDPRKFVYSNGTEGNRRVIPIPDTEDLNGDGILNTTENYFEYTIDLGADTSAYLETNVRTDYAGCASCVAVAANNGWRRYRIPLDDVARVAFGSPVLARSQQLRLWIEGMYQGDSDPAYDTTIRGDNNITDRPLLVIGGLDIVGNRWQSVALDSTQVAQGATMTLNTVNTVDNADIYDPPFDPGETRTGSQAVQIREQSLALEFTNLGVGDTLEAYKTLSLDENYSRYGNLNWFVAGYEVPGYVPGQDTLYYYMRFASDETEQSYYEYRAPLPKSSGPHSIAWNSVTLPLTALSNLKLRRDFPSAATQILYYADGPDGVKYVIKGRPSFTRLRRLSVGLINGSGPTAKVWPSGQLWIDELRATDVAKDVGHAKRVSVTGNVANLLSYNAAYSSRDANFLSVGETMGSGSSADGINVGSTLQLHRFFEGTGIVLPITYAYARSTSKPLFSAGDDVVRSGDFAAASETFSSNTALAASYSRSWSDRSNPLLRYTLGGITANWSQIWADNHNPSSVGTHNGFTDNVNWDIAPRSLLSLALPRTKMRFYPLPERLWWHYAMQKNTDTTWTRDLSSPDSLVLLNSNTSRTASVAFGGDSRPIDLFHHHFEGIRNLSLTPDLLKNGGMLGPINFGRVTQWSQSFDAAYTFQTGNWMRPRVSWNSGYSQNNGPELSPDLSARAVANNQGAHLSWDLPFNKLAPPARIPGKRDTTGGGFSPLRQAGGLLSRLGTLSLDATVAKTTSYTRLAGTPSWAYLLGLADDPGLGDGTGGRVLPLFGNLAAKTLRRDLNASSRIDIGFNAFVSARGEVGDQQSLSNSIHLVTSTLRFPDLEVDYGKIPSAIRLDHMLNNPRLRTSISRSQSWSRQDGDLTGASDGWDMRPLLGINGDFKNGTRAEVKVDRRSTVSTTFLGGESRQEAQTTTLNLTLNRTYSQGQKVNFLGKETTVRSTVTLGLTGAYEKNTGQTIKVLDGIGQAPQFQKDSDRLSLRGTGSYGFSNNVTGNASLGFLQDRDNEIGIVHRSVTVELRASFNF